MTVKYKLYQDKKKGSTYVGKWYARTVVSNVVGINELAEFIQENCSMKKSDVIAVLTELSTVIRRELLNGSRVVINGLGSFKVTISTKPADSPADWTPKKCLRRAKVNFRPETEENKTTEAYTRTIKILNGLKLEQLEEYKVTSE
ncbi:MAG: HU family DNA-binding protein [Prevotellaceae bacterium]|nr:HU family DNA-binding protein [Prevotellaceae bacterium]